MSAWFSPEDARLDRMINDEGIDQLTACRMLWGPPRPPDPPRPLVDPTPAHVEWAQAWVRHLVQIRLARVLSWLAVGVEQ